MKKSEFLKKIISYFWKRKKWLIIFGVTAFYSFLASMIQPFLDAQLLQAITRIDFRAILMFGLFVAILGFVSNFIDEINSETSSRLQDYINLDLQSDVARELFSLEQKNFDEKGTAFFTQRINGDTYRITSIFWDIRHHILGTFSSFGSLLYVFILCFPMGIYFVIVSLIQFLISRKKMSIWKKSREKRDLLYENHHSSFTEIIRGIRDIKGLNLKDVMIDKTIKEQNLILNQEFLTRKENRFFEQLSSFLSVLSNFGMLLLGVFFITKGILLGANFLVLYMYKGKAMGFIQSLESMFESKERFTYALKRVLEIVDGKTYSKEQYGLKTIDKMEGDIVFSNVSFGYNESNVLNGVSFHIKPNETIGIVGKSGVGKSTIFGLIPKLYQRDSGDILFDGISIDELSESSLRGNISIITQNPYLFHMSIRENLKIVKSSATDEEMIQKCQLCAFDQYVNSLEKGYDTLIGEGGVTLSGGLRQRLAIARSLMKESEIILLDEATSALDNETQDFIKESIHQISKDYTILIIAHRLSTVKDCDRIFVVDDGKIVGTGSHEELMETNEIYQHLYQKEL